MSDADSIVDQRPVFPVGIPFVYIHSAHFEFQRCGYAVVRLKLVIARLLPMFMQVDEPERNHEPLRFNRLFPFQCAAADRAYFPSADSHVPHRFQPRLRVHHSSVRNHYVIQTLFSPRGLSRNGSNAQHQRRRDSCCQNGLPTALPIVHRGHPFPPGRKFLAVYLLCQSLFPPPSIRPSGSFPLTFPNPLLTFPSGNTLECGSPAAAFSFPGHSSITRRGKPCSLE